MFEILINKIKEIPKEIIEKHNKRNTKRQYEIAADIIRKWMNYTFLLKVILFFIYLKQKI